MPFIQANYFSTALMRDISFCALLPALNTPSIPGQFMPGGKILPPTAKFQTLYLLHGIFGNERSWLSSSRIEQYAAERNIAVIMPSGDLSFYADMEIGEGAAYNYGKFIGKELVDVTRLMFPLSTEREDTFIAGLSMGGYGASRVGLEYADTFGAIGALSGVLDAVEALRQIDEGPGGGLDFVWKSCFESLEKMENSTNDLFYMSKKRKDEGKLPFIYQACGTEDFLYTANTKFRDHMKNVVCATSEEYIYEEGPGVHDWKFWDSYIQTCLDKFPLKRKAIL